MKAPFLELKPGYDGLSSEIDAANQRVMDSGLYEQFEAEFAALPGGLLVRMTSGTL